MQRLTSAQAPERKRDGLAQQACQRGFHVPDSKAFVLAYTESIARL
jgi:hypothetical protein